MSDGSVPEVRAAMDVWMRRKVSQQERLASNWPKCKPPAVNAAPLFNKLYFLNIYFIFTLFPFLNPLLFPPHSHFRYTVPVLTADATCRQLSPIRPTSTRGTSRFAGINPGTKPRNKHRIVFNMNPRLYFLFLAAIFALVAAQETQVSANFQPPKTRVYTRFSSRILDE